MALVSGSALPVRVREALKRVLDCADERATLALYDHWAVAGDAMDVAERAEANAVADLLAAIDPLVAGLLLRDVAERSRRVREDLDTSEFIIPDTWGDGG